MGKPNFAILQMLRDFHGGKMEFSFYLVALLFAVCSSKEIPAFLKICHRSDPDVNACIKNSIESLRSHLKNGDPENNIPSVEPIVINDLIKEESGGLKIETTSVVAHGGSNFIVQDIKSDYENLKFEVNILLPRLTIDAKYTLDGKVAMLPIKGQGDFFANLTDCSGHCFFTVTAPERDGEQYLHLANTEMKVTVGGGHVRLDNLFGGEKTLNKMINEIINDNLSVFIKEFLPYIERGLARTFTNSGNQFISGYTRNQLLPE